MNKILVTALLIASTAEAGVFTDKYKNFELCARAAQAQADSYDMPVKGRDDAVELCRGDQARGPIDCAKAAIGISPTLSSKQIAKLCSGAGNMAPITCMKEATKTIGDMDSFVRSVDNALVICARAKNTRSLDCARELSKQVKLSQSDATFRSVDEVATVCSAENN